MKIYLPLLFLILEAQALYASPTASKTLLSSPFHLAYQGAGIASFGENFSYLLNPAALGFHRRSKSALAYTRKQDKNQMLSFAITDLKSGFPLGFNYERSWSSQFTKEDLYKVHISSGVAINPFLAFGVNIEREVFKKEKKWYGSLGALLRISSKTGIGLTANDLVFYNDSSLKNQRSKSLNLGFYQKFLKSFRARLDVSYQKRGATNLIQDDYWVGKASIESFLRKFIVVRLGSSFNFETQEDTYGAGLSFYGPKLQLDYQTEKRQSFYQHALILKLLI